MISCLDCFDSAKNECGVMISLRYADFISFRYIPIVVLLGQKVNLYLAVRDILSIQLAT